MLQNSDAEKKVIRRIAVFCGSSRGTERIFEEQAYELGKTLAVQNIELVYGGANVVLLPTESWKMEAKPSGSYLLF